MSAQLTDQQGRRFSYLRLSVTDACNFRCTYCLPHGYRKPQGAQEPLTLEEIKNLVSAFSGLGTWKVRITGGEPTLRADLFDIISAVRSTPGIRRIAISTNGHRLKQNAKAFKALGVSALNISVDTLDPLRFREITGRDSLAEILAGIETALESGFDAIKINAVLMKNVNEELSPFLNWIRARAITVRFIELMPTGTNQALFKSKHLQSTAITQELLDKGWKATLRKEADGPAQEFEHPNYLGKIGIIAPYSKDFCSSCNRLRVSSQGGLQLCLFGEGRHSIRYLLQAPSQKEQLMDEIRTLVGQKKVSHYLQEGTYGSNQTFSSIGG